MKSKIYVKLSMLVALCGLCLCLAVGMLACGNKQENANADINDYTISVPYKENFQVLQLTDTHWLGKSD